MSSVVVSFESGASIGGLDSAGEMQIMGENLEILAQQGEENKIRAKPAEGATGLGSVSIIGGAEDDDIILAKIGGSTILGFDGDDRIVGSAQNDLIDGGEDDDFIQGGKGNDIIKGGLGDDNIFGNNGNDIITAGAGDDNVNGGRGNDMIKGGLGNDTIMGGAGNDTIMGGAGADELEGGKGLDVFKFAASEFESDAVDEITDFTEMVDVIHITGVGADGVSYDSATGMVSVDGADAINIGEGKDLEIKGEDGKWEIF